MHPDTNTHLIFCFCTIALSCNKYQPRVLTFPQNFKIPMDNFIVCDFQHNHCSLNTSCHPLPLLRPNRTFLGLLPFLHSLLSGIFLTTSWPSVFLESCCSLIKSQLFVLMCSWFFQGVLNVNQWAKLSFTQNVFALLPADDACGLSQHVY